MFKHFIKLKQKNKKMMNTNDRLTNLEYQIKYGSDDNDETRKSKYLNIINNFECLYSTTC